MNCHVKNFTIDKKVISTYLGGNSIIQKNSRKERDYEFCTFLLA
jgi:hypothetical protein